MAKQDTFYFTHDYNARNDSKIKKLLSKHGYLGYGIFWAIIEDLYNNANALPLDCESIAFDLRTDSETIKSIIMDFDLFIVENNLFGSRSVQKRLEDRDAKSIKARESAFKRWGKIEKDANALPPQSEPNAIKESKEEEIKRKEIEKKKDFEDRKLKFAHTLEEFKNTYPRELLTEFYKYWIEPNKSQTKFRQEMEKTWDLERRLETWVKNDKNFSKPIGQTATVGKIDTSKNEFKQDKW